MHGLSYWVYVKNQDGSLIWEGMVSAREENQTLKIMTGETDIEFLRTMQLNPHAAISWEPVWEDVTDKYRLNSGSENANISALC